jgi:hypothetical protein
MAAQPLYNQASLPPKIYPQNHLFHQLFDTFDARNLN